jgi:8-oxo-dGTP pyrophosphatase MutT (NUDIX family)
MTQMSGADPVNEARTTLERIVAAVRRHAPEVAERDEPYFEAAVALVLRAARSGAVELLMIERATRESDPWSGQIALPGGRYDAADETLERTAVRETREETALDLLGQGDVIGALSEIRPRSPLLPPVIVRPYVATIAADAAIVASEEVASHFWVPLDALFARGASRETEIFVRGFRMRRDAIHYRGHVIWGMTERILRDFEEVIR